MYAIEISDLSFTYENRTTPALDHVNLRVKDQESVLLAGASGSGKPTLLKCINGLIPHRYIGQYSGQVNLAGKPVAALDLDELSLVVGTVLQEPDKQLVSSSVENDVAFGAKKERTWYRTVQFRPADYMALVVIGCCLIFAVYLRTRFTTYWIPT